MEQGTKVRFQIVGEEYTGVICGKSQEEQPIIRRVWQTRPLILKG